VKRVLTLFCLSSFVFPTGLVSAAPSAPLVASNLVPIPDAEVIFEVNETWFASDKKGPQFVIPLTAHDAAGNTFNSDAWKDNLRAVLYAPDERLLLSQLTTNTLDPMVTSSDIDPKWSYVWLELWGRAPKAADGLNPFAANGKFSEQLTLKLPYPGANQEIEVNRTLTSSLGTTLRIETLSFIPNGNGGEIKGTFQLLPPLDAQEAYVFAKLPVIFGDDKYRIPISKSGSFGRTGDMHRFSIKIESLPLDKVLRLGFPLQQTAPSKATAAYRFHSKIKVPIPALPTVKAVALPFTPFQSAGLEGKLEVDGSLRGSMWSGSLLVHDSKNPDLYYKADSIQFMTRDGQPLPGGLVSLPDETSRLSQNPYRFRQTVWCQKVPADLSQLMLKATLTPRKALITRFKAQCPIPKAGETLTLNQEIPTSTGIDLRLVAARYYENVEDFPGAPSEFVPKRGIAYVFASQPAFETSLRKIESESHDFARDDLMRPLDGAPAIRWRGNNALQAQSPEASQPGFFTAFVPAPAKDAKSLELTATLREFGVPGPAVEVTVPSVPLPLQG
jgi:hypothetical protein